jgi:hypothetical protein
MNGRQDSLRTKIRRKLYQIEGAKKKLEMLLSEWSDLTAELEKQRIIDREVDKHLEKRRANVYDLTALLSLKKL